MTDTIKRLRDRLRGSVAMRGDAMVGVEPRELTALLDIAEAYRAFRAETGTRGLGELDAALARLDGES